MPQMTLNDLMIALGALITALGTVAVAKGRSDKKPDPMDVFGDLIKSNTAEMRALGRELDGMAGTLRDIDQNTSRTADRIGEVLTEMKVSAARNRGIGQ